MFTFKKKGDVFVVSFFIIILIGIFVLVQFTYQDKNIDASSGVTKAEAASSAVKAYSNLIQNEVTNILMISTKKAMFETALNALDTENGYLMTYGIPRMPELELTKTRIKNRALPYCNGYLEGIQGSNYGVIEYNKAGSLEDIKIWVSETSLIDGSTNEEFTASAEGAGNNPAIAVEPYDMQITKNTEFQINVTIHNAKDIYAVEFELSYDPEVLTYIKAEKGNVFSSGFFEPTIITNDPPGKLKKIILTLIGTTPVIPGEGTLVKFTFRSKEEGSSGITITNQNIGGANTQIIPSTPYHGLVTVKSGALNNPKYPEFKGIATVKAMYQIDGINTTVGVPYKLTAQIMNLRYWYMYKIIRGWVETNVVGKEACNRMIIIKGNASDDPSCKAINLETNQEQLVKNILDASNNKLQASFNDNDIKCEYKILCKNVKTNFQYRTPCPDGCIVWPCANYTSNTSCFAGGCNNEENCQNPSTDYPPKPNCNTEKQKIDYSGTYESGGFPVIASKYHSSGAITYSTNHTVSFITEFTCVDKKFSDLDNGNLIFKFLLHAYIFRGDPPDYPPCPCLIGGGGGGGVDQIPNDELEDEPDPCPNLTCVPPEIKVGCVCKLPEQKLE